MRIRKIINLVVGVVLCISIAINVAQYFQTEEMKSKVAIMNYFSEEYHVTIDGKIESDAEVLATGEGKVVIRIGEYVYVTPIEKVVFE